MDNIGLGILLWLAYICFFSCLLSTPSPTATQAPKKKKALTIEQGVKQFLEEEISTELRFPPPATVPLTDAQVLEVIGKLTKRQARRLCQPLGIQQKCNDVELTLDLTRGAIRKAYGENAGLVIATIQDRLPELLVASQPTEKTDVWADAV